MAARAGRSSAGSARRAARRKRGRARSGAKRGGSLDVDELLMLAVGATQRGETQEAAHYLDRALELDEANAHAWFLVGGLQASAGNTDRAVQAMQKALETAPDYAAARFQLGLLYLTSGEVNVAREIWQPLDALGEESFYLLFKRAWLHLVEDRFDACIEDIERGIALNRENRALSREMAKLAERARRALDAHTSLGPS